MNLSKGVVSLCCRATGSCVQPRKLSHDRSHLTGYGSPRAQNMHLLLDPGASSTSGFKHLRRLVFEIVVEFPTHLKNMRKSNWIIESSPQIEGKIHIWNHHFIFFSTLHNIIHWESSKHSKQKNAGLTCGAQSLKWFPRVPPISTGSSGATGQRKTGRIDYYRGHVWRHFSWIHVY